MTFFFSIHFMQTIKKECNIFLSEATKNGFIEAGLFTSEHMEEEFQYAIHVYDILKTRCKKYGHTYQEESKFRKELKKHMDRPVRNEEWDRLKGILSDNEAVKCIEIRKISKMFLYDLWKKESFISEALKDLQRNGSQEVDGLATNLSLDKMDKNQKDAVKSMKHNALTIVSGKGGTGKTTVVLKVVADFPREKVALTAPTGKAAANLKKVSKGIHESCTLHQLTASYYRWQKRQKAALNES